MSFWWLRSRPSNTVEVNTEVIECPPIGPRICSQRFGLGGLGDFVIRKILFFPLRLIATFISLIVGRFNWDAPKWIRLVAHPIDSLINRWLNRIANYRESNPSGYRKISVAIVTALIAIFGVGYWYCNLPEPFKISYSISEPLATELKEDAIPNPLKLLFSGSAGKIALVGKTIAQGISIAPEVKGDWRWENDTTLTFQPTGDWPVGQSYSVKLGKGIFASTVALEKYSFEFKSPPFSASVESSEFYEDPTNPKIKQVVTAISFSHPVDKSDLEKRISVKMRVNPVKNFNDSRVKQLGFQVNYSENSAKAYIRSTSISIPDEDGEVLVTMSKGTRAARGGTPSDIDLNRTTQIPGVDNYFRIDSVNTNFVTDPDSFQTDRVLAIESTARATTKEIFGHTELYLLPAKHAEYDRIKELGISVDSGESSEGGEEEEASEGEESSGQSDSTQCPLNSASQVTEDIIRDSQKLAASFLPSEQDASLLHSIKYSAPEGRCLFVRINKGAKSAGDYELTKDKVFLFPVEPFPSEVQILHKGSLLSLTGEQKLSLMGRNVPSIRVKLYRVLPGSFHHIISQSNPWSNFSEPNFNYGFGPENISELFTTVLPLSSGGLAGIPQYTNIDFKEFLSEGDSPRGMFFMEAVGWNPDSKSQIGEVSRRLILVTDLGFVVKQNVSGDRDVFVASLAQKQPVVGSTVQVIGKNGLPVFTGETDPTGKVSVPGLNDFKNEKEPQAYLVKKDADMAFMPIDRSDRDLNFSRFDVGGLYSDSNAESLQAFLFSDRGIYRPGEEAKIGIIVKDRVWAALPNALPLELTVTDPKGSEVLKDPIRIPADGFTEFTFPVSESSLTGTFSLSLSLVRSKYRRAFLGSAQIRVEEFMPDRLKISSRLTSNENSLGEVRGWVSPDNLKIVGTLRNLFGTPAILNKMSASLRLSPAVPSFIGYEDYRFSDPLKTKNSFDESLGEESTNDEGEAVFDLNLGRFERGIYRAWLKVEGFEKESGRSVIANMNTLVSPLPFLIGVKEQGDLSFVRSTDKVGAHVVALGSDLRKVKASDLSLVLEESKYVSVLTKLESGNLAYQSVEKKTQIETKALEISEGGLSLAIPNTRPGNYRYIIQDSTGLSLATIPFTVVGNADVSRSLEKNAELQIKLNKKDYSPGEEIELQVVAPYTGYGLITIERDKTYAHSWFTTDTTASMQKIRVPESLDGNAYVNVTFVRALDSKDINLSPLSYGVQPFSVSRDRRTQKVILSAPKQIKPGEVINIDVSASIKTKAVIYGVDEGILQVARYKTPDPLSYFFRKKALEVKTSQILDLLLPEYSLTKSVSETGGDEDAMLARHKNPFKRKGQKPVVFWSGVREIGPEASRIQMSVPDYFNGNIRLFALTVSPQKVGVSESTTVVQGDLVITPHVPLALTPGDMVEVNAVVTNTSGDSKDVKVALSADLGVSIVGSAEKHLDVEKGRDGVASFQIKATENLGSANLIFNASSGTKSARYTIDTSIRPASTRITTAKYGKVQAGLISSGVAEISTSRDLYSQESKREISLSTSPVALAKSLATYLEKYPHGCTEQITSAAFPTLILSDFKDIGLSKADTEKMLARTFRLLAARQGDDGTFQVWPGPSENTERWLSIHAFRFVIEAKERGFSVPEILFKRSVNALHSISNSEPESLNDAREVAHSIYLLTRLGVVTRNYLEGLKETLKRSDWSWKGDLTALFMAASYKLLKMDSDAEVLRKGVKLIADKPTDLGELPYYFNPLLHAGYTLSILSRHFPESLQGNGEKLISKISEALSGDSFSTVSSALAIAAISDYQRTLGSLTDVSAEVRTGVSKDNLLPLALGGGLFRTGALPPADRFIQVTNSSKLPIFFSVLEDGFDKRLPNQESAGLEVFKEYLDDNGNVIQKASIGSDVTVRLVLRTLSKTTISSPVAIVDLFPSGFEMFGGTANLFNETNGGGVSALTPEYVDAREDRMMLYGWLSNDAMEFRYKLKAASKGSFVIPPSTVEAMYDPAQHAISASGSFVIE